MRKYVLLIIALVFTVSCSRLDSDNVQQWLESLDPDTKVIEVWCKATVEQPIGSGAWKPFDFAHQFSAAEVLEGAADRGLDWAGMVARMIKVTEVDFPGWVAAENGLPAMSGFRVKNVSCNGKPLRSPPIQVPRCPNATNGCEEPPMPTDLPPPPPPPPGGGDF